MIEYHIARCLYHLYEKQKEPVFLTPCVFVIPARFERATHSLEGCCSIQLSYGTGRPQKYTIFKIRQAKLFIPLFLVLPAELKQDDNLY